MEAGLSSGNAVLMKGNEAACEGAIAGGCRFFFGYPITPQNEIPQYMAEHLPEVGGVFLQAESEVAAINMVFGAAAAGVRAMTSSSGPGIALMQEGLSYIVGARLPCVVIDMARGGPGLGNIATSQSDYWLATRGAGHGDSRCITLAPAGLQELYDLTSEAFDLADAYRHPVMVLGEASLGQMMEPVRLRPRDQATPPPKPWAVGGVREGRPPNVLNSLYAQPPDLERENQALMDLYEQLEGELVRWQEVGDDEPDVLLVAFGIVARSCETAMQLAGEEGLRCRLFRPITLFPFPTHALREAAQRASKTLVVEASGGQMIDDVRIAVGGRSDVTLMRKLGGLMITPEQIAEHLAHM
jgi:2-oxoglutarate/2-oxoacid ferredoxin oxidoreductase subunit alpha